MVVSPLETRYKTEMNAVFEEENRLKRWLDVEVALARAHASCGNIPNSSANEIARASKKVKLARVKQIDSKIHHDLMAVVKALAEQCSGEAGGHIHLGATSYDIEDCATALQLRDAIAILEPRLLKLQKTLASLALKHKKTVCIGRSHGQHAVPTTYGLKFAIFEREIARNIERLNDAKKRLYVGKMSGAVGTMATFGERAFEIEKHVMNELKLKPSEASNQIIQRDRIAEALSILALTASTLDKLAKEIRNLQRTEIAELAEPFANAQVGSSTMPQKRNPHRCERICSLARVVRAYSLVALENIALEHERDLTNSANERIIISSSFILTDYMLKEANEILAGLEFFPENIKKNLELTRGLVLAERVMIALAKKGMSRQLAHEKIRKASILANRAKKHLNDVLANDSEIARLLSKNELKQIFRAETYIGKATEIAERAVKK
ncbi:MAG: adenylosuccinate lyase [Candidatus Micrarchaeota archaeon]